MIAQSAREVEEELPASVAATTEFRQCGVQFWRWFRWRRFRDVSFRSRAMDSRTPACPLACWSLRKHGRAGRSSPPLLGGSHFALVRCGRFCASRRGEVERGASFARQTFGGFGSLSRRVCSVPAFFSASALFRPCAGQALTSQPGCRLRRRLPREAKRMKTKRRENEDRHRHEPPEFKHRVDGVCARPNFVSDREPMRRDSLRGTRTWSKATANGRAPREDGSSTRSSATFCGGARHHRELFAAPSALREMKSYPAASVGTERPVVIRGQSSASGQSPRASSRARLRRSRPSIAFSFSREDITLFSFFRTGEAVFLANYFAFATQSATIGSIIAPKARASDRMAIPREHIQSTAAIALRLIFLIREAPLRRSAANPCRVRSSLRETVASCSPSNLPI